PLSQLERSRPYAADQGASAFLIKILNFTSLGFWHFVHNVDSEGTVLEHEKQIGSLGLFSGFIIGNNAEFIYAKDGSGGEGVDRDSGGSDSPQDSRK
ncbi:hypothetical protein, partial [Neobacillus bataviensis]|uniref:hypothetical protein n=1 Tax=Neobacillus bataviensis TaxID=220685 RepID=UPI001F2CF59C